jgi:hypothetical protein
MKVTVRALESGDLNSKLPKLRRLTYPHLPEDYDIEPVWRWLRTHPLADQIHRWVLATEEGGLVGHLGAIPQCYRINGQRLVAYTPGDYMVLPPYGFHAISLMRRFFRSAQNCVSVDQVHEAIAVEKRLGAREVGDLQFAVKVRDISRLPGLPSLIPLPLQRPLNVGLRAIDKLVTSTLRTGSLKAETLDGFDEPFDELFESIAASVPCVPEKNARFLQWRYGPGSPQEPVLILGVWDGSTLLGYAALSVSSNQTGHVLDLTVRPGRRDVAQSILGEAIRRFAREGVRGVAYRFLESPTSPRAKDLWRLGFLPNNRGRHKLLVKFADHGPHEAASDPNNWSYAIGDGEASFWAR